MAKRTTNTRLDQLLAEAESVETSRIKEVRDLLIRHGVDFEQVQKSNQTLEETQQAYFEALDDPNLGRLEKVIAELRRASCDDPAKQAKVQEAIATYTAEWKSALAAAQAKARKIAPRDEPATAKPSAIHGTEAAIDMPPEPPGQWSKSDGLTQWARVFGFSATTLKRRFKDGTIRHKRYSDKNYSIHIDDLPKPPK